MPNHIPMKRYGPLTIQAGNLTDDEKRTAGMKHQTEAQGLRIKHRKRRRVVVIPDLRLSQLLNPGTGAPDPAPDVLAAFMEYTEILYGAADRGATLALMEAVADYYPEMVIHKPEADPGPNELRAQLERDRVGIRINGQSVDLY